MRNFSNKTSRTTIWSAPAERSGDGAFQMEQFVHISTASPERKAVNGGARE